MQIFTVILQIKKNTATGKLLVTSARSEYDAATATRVVARKLQLAGHPVTAVSDFKVKVGNLHACVVVYFYFLCRRSVRVMIIESCYYHPGRQ